MQRFLKGSLAFVNIPRFIADRFVSRAFRLVLSWRRALFMKENEDSLLCDKAPSGCNSTYFTTLERRQLLRPGHSTSEAGSVSRVQMSLLPCSWRFRGQRMTLHSQPLLGPYMQLWRIKRLGRAGVVRWSTSSQNSRTELDLEAVRMPCGYEMLVRSAI